MLTDRHTFRQADRYTDSQSENDTLIAILRTHTGCEVYIGLLSAKVRAVKNYVYIPVHNSANHNIILLGGDIIHRMLGIFSLH